MTLPANRLKGLKSRREYRDLCARVLERDGVSCTVCGQPAAEVHHRVPLSRGGANTAENLVSLCERHHILADGATAIAVAAAASAA